jgi:hypothetical protein
VSDALLALDEAAAAYGWSACTPQPRRREYRLGQRWLVVAFDAAGRVAYAWLYRAGALEVAVPYGERAKVVRLVSLLTTPQRLYRAVIQGG